MSTSFLKQQTTLLWWMGFIVIWLLSLSTLLRLHSTLPLNAPVSLSDNRDLHAVRKIDSAGRYDCVLIYEPEGSIADELNRLYETYLAKTRQEPLGRTGIDVECTAYRVDERERVHSARIQGLVDFEELPRMHLMRIQPATLASGFRLEPGVYVVKARVHGDQARLGAANLAARVDLIGSDHLAPHWHGNLWLMLIASIVVNTLLVFVLAGLIGVVLFRVLKVVVQAIAAVLIERYRPFDGPAISSFRAYSPAKKKLVIALPVILCTGLLLNTSISQDLKGYIGIALIVSVAVSIVAAIEAIWSEQVHRCARVYESLRPGVRDLVTVLVVIGSIVFFFVVFRIIGVITSSL